MQNTENSNTLQVRTKVSFWLVQKNSVDNEYVHNLKGS